jgi:hypothetical protein
MADIDLGSLIPIQTQNAVIPMYQDGFGRIIEAVKDLPHVRYVYHKDNGDGTFIEYFFDNKGKFVFANNGGYQEENNIQQCVTYYLYINNSQSQNQLPTAAQPKRVLYTDCNGQNQEVYLDYVPVNQYIKINAIGQPQTFSTIKITTEPIVNTTEYVAQQQQQGQEEVHPADEYVYVTPIKLQELPYFMLANESFVTEWWLNPTESLSRVNQMIARLNQNEVDALRKYYVDKKTDISIIGDKVDDLISLYPTPKAAEDFTGDDYDIIDVVTNIELYGKTIIGNVDMNARELYIQRYYPQETQTNTSNCEIFTLNNISPDMYDDEGGLLDTGIEVTYTNCNNEQNTVTVYRDAPFQVEALPNSSFTATYIGILMYENANKYLQISSAAQNFDRQAYYDAMYERAMSISTLPKEQIINEINARKSTLDMLSEDELAVYTKYFNALMDWAEGNGSNLEEINNNANFQAKWNALISKYPNLKF